MRVVVVRMVVVGEVWRRRRGVKSVVVPVLELLEVAVLLGLLLVLVLLVLVLLVLVLLVLVLLLLVLLPPGPRLAFRLACPRHLVGVSR
jgi:hypothetical protein